jgi:maltokinase
VSDLEEQLAAVLPAHMARQRWFAKDREDVPLRVSRAEELDPSSPRLLRVVVEAETGDRYQLLLGLRSADDPVVATFGDVAPVGVIDTGGGPVFCYDALVDPELGLELLRHVAPAQAAATVRPIGAEQSNTSLVYDERLILKVFRRLTGANPEIEVTVALAREGFAHVAAPLAVWRSDGDDLAILQRFLAGGTEGWALALTSVRDLLADGSDPDEAGGDLGPEAERLGVMTAELHLAMAGAFGVQPGEPGAWADATRARVGSVHHPDVDGAGIAAVLDRVASLDQSGRSIRIHGDYHLGQVMRTDEGWFVLDFEGEPTRPVAERRQTSSPLRDVAGMLRSFGYAAAVGLREHGPASPDPAPGHLADAWERHNRDAFLTAYLARMEGSELLPPDLSATRALLDMFELDKAVYEVGYEQAHRPDWVQIPLGAVRRLVDAST